MITDEQIEAAQPRLQEKKLGTRDVLSLTSIFRAFVGSLESDYNYDFKTSLESLDDNDDTFRAATMIAGLEILENKQFKVGKLQGGRSGIYNSQAEYRMEVVKYLFGILYPIPAELSTFNVQRWILINGHVSSTVENCFEP